LASQISEEEMRDQDVIEAFVVFLRGIGFPNLMVDRWPDEENRQTKEIDAIAGPFAIEHTSIDSIPHQHRNDDWYLRVAGGLEQEFSDSVDFHLSVILEYDAIKKGQDWDKLRAALKSWVSSNAFELPYGWHDMILPVDPPLSSPFRLRVRKWKEGPRGVFFPRFAPPEDKTLSERIRKILDRKGAKLAKYQRPGTTTVLLVENDDIALMNEAIMLSAIREAYPNGLPDGVDKLWFADTSIPENPRFCDFTSGIVGVCY